MGSDRFTKVFDILDAGFWGWGILAIALMPVAFGVAYLLLPTIVRKLGIPFMNFSPGWNVVVGCILVVLGILTVGGLFFGTYLSHQQLKGFAQDGHCRVAEGHVERFVPGDATRPMESFAVGGVTFRYSDFAFTSGFNNTSALGGPVRADQYVRICYDPAQNTILRLEIRDFTGEAKSYARPLWPIPTFDARSAGISGYQQPWAVPWLGSLLMVLLIVDALAVQGLFLPYLRVFLRIKNAALPDIAIPDRLQPGTRIKLGHSMIYWDATGHAIWLRPRGLNFLQAPGTVAKLQVDPGEPTIIGGEIYLSPVLPLALALMLLFFYLATSAQVAAAKAPLPVESFLIVGAFVIAFGFVGLRMLRRRMETFVLDALHDIRHQQR
jgi:hypothetical protein